MRQINLNLKSNPYNVYIEASILDASCDYISKVYHNKNIYIITDSNVSKYYLQNLEDVLSKKFSCKHIIVNAGESSKSFESYQKVLEELIDLDIRRNELLIALGGGVVGDLTGFVASTIYRGVPYIQIPTSLLAQMDSSIGGKTGIDFYNRKNIVGAFKQPLLVLIDPNTLKTLPKEEFSNGMAELIKHGIIGNEKLFKALLDGVSIDENIIYESLSVKANVVCKDEFDTGLRMILNFGHTFGHIVELERNIRHGEAVALGMLMAIKLGIDLGVTKKELYEQTKQILMSYNLPYEDIDYHKYLEKTIYDKKNLAGVVNFILIDKLGHSIIYPINESKIKELK